MNSKCDECLLSHVRKCVMGSAIHGEKYMKELKRLPSQLIQKKLCLGSIPIKNYLNVIFLSSVFKHKFQLFKGK